LTFFASVSVLTSMWEQCTLSGIAYSWFCWLLSFSSEFTKLTQNKGLLVFLESLFKILTIIFHSF
jgi:hypothetical protein